MEPGTRKRRILVVDDDRAVVDYLVEMLEARGYAASGTTSPEEALRLASPPGIEMVIADVEMPGLRGIDLLKALRAERSEALVLLITAFGSVDMAVEAARAGACDFIAKPFKIAALYHAIGRSFEDRQIRREVVRLRSSLPGAAPGEIVFRSAVMQSVVECAQRAARSDSSILITGETGTGKGYLARFVHARSLRHERPFVQIDCGALSEPVLEAELFGSDSASPGLPRPYHGLLAEAAGGTVLLDEVGELPATLQARLLRFLETGSVRAIHEETERFTDVRLIAATRRPLEEFLRIGRFRPDLYSRLNGIRLELPPLRERTEDIEALVDVCLQRATVKLDPPVLGLSAEALRWLIAQHWPGNVRELCNLIERALALTDSDILLLDDLLKAASASLEHDFMRDALARGTTLAELEQAYIRKALELTAGNKVQAARLLGIDRRTVYRRAGLDEPDDDTP